MLYNVTTNVQYRKSYEILADEMKLANTHPDTVKTAICHFLSK